MSILIDDGKSENENIMKCDIGEFVVTIEKLKQYCKPVVKVVNYGIAIFRWEKPILSILTMIFCCTIFMINPVYMLICILLPIPPWLVVEYFRMLFQRKLSKKQYSDYVQRKDEPYHHFVRQAAEEKQKERLNMFLDILVGLQRIFLDAVGYFEYLQSVITWKRQKLSLLLLLGSLCIEFMIYLLDIRVVLCFITICWFLLNRYFVLAVKRSITKGKSFVTSLHYTKSPKKGKNDVGKHHSPVAPVITEEEKIITNQPEDIDTSSVSDSDDGESSKKEEAAANSTRANPTGFAMSMFIPNSIKRRYMGGNCSSCGQPASILKKRRYCRHCGNSFCSRCCYMRVPRAFLGATAPAAYQEKVLVCEACHAFLANRMKTTPSELVE